MPLISRRGDTDWRPILDVLSTQSVYERRLDALLARVCELTLVPECHLYLTPESGEHLHLESVRFPLALVVRQAQQEHRLTCRLAALSARVEAGRRLQVSGSGEVHRAVARPCPEVNTDRGRLHRHRRAGFGATHHSGAGQPSSRIRGPDRPLPRDGAVRLVARIRGRCSHPAGRRHGHPATRLGIRSLLAVPLSEESEPVGIFALVNFGAGGTLDAENLELLATFSEQITLMLHNGRLFERFADRYIETVRGLARSLDVRRAHTHGHHDKVARVERPSATNCR